MQLFSRFLNLVHTNIWVKIVLELIAQYYGKISRFYNHVSLSKWKKGAVKN